jgi:TetR/AcrR family transcriptional regulator, transcriptional repressor for nem operon
MSKAALTRSDILGKAFTLMYQKGYQATSIDEIIARTKVTKGAFFHHFSNKEEMGLAVIDEIMYPGLLPYMKNALNRTGDIRVNLYTMMEDLLLHNSFFKVEYGCPAVNMIEEMAPLNRSFKKGLAGIMKQWHSAIRSALMQAQERKSLHGKFDAGQVATYIISGYAGIRNTGKLLGRRVYHDYLAEFKIYLDRLV